MRRGARRAALFVVALVCVAALWEFYKAVGPEDGAEIFGWRLVPKASDRAMPHTWTMVQRLFDPEVRGRDTPIWRAVLGYSWYTFRMAFVGLVLGGVFGVALAIVMARFKVIERGLLPYVIASQTVPLIALAPQVAAIGGNWDLPKWMWVSSLGAFLAFFPIAVATLKGLSTAPAASLELMDSSTGVRGIGFASLTYGQKATSDPAQLYTAVFGAATIGLLMFGLVVGIEAIAMRNRPQEASA
jgi:NitT/TauT family transport system permease protein